MTIQPGTDIGRYHILEQLGEGGMAVVYKAYDTRLEREVALKIIRVGAFPPDQLARILKRFEREAKLLARLTHPNIVPIIDYGEFEKSPYLVMSYLQGGTLKKLLTKPMSWQKAVQLLLPIAHALTYAHAREIIHRDVKPSNILITDSGDSMLSDFGIAKILGSAESETLTSTGVGVGTPEYMAPEQWLNQVTAKTDIYALGVVLYELVTGKKPYTADTPAAVLLKQSNDPLPRPRQYIPDLPGDVEKVIFKTLAKDPKERYASMQEFAQALENILASSHRVDEEEHIPAVRMEDRTQDKIRAPEKNKGIPGRIWAAVGLGVVALIMIIFVIGRGSSTKPISPLMTTKDVFPTLMPTVTLEPTPTNVPTPSLGIGSTMVSEKDGMQMMYVPAGAFEMGSNNGANNEKPEHTIYLDAFWIDRTEVTNAQYSQCVKAGSCKSPGGKHLSDSNYALHPVTYIVWENAIDYCTWAGRRLPTEAEWEKAARGNDQREYPWGKSLSNNNYCSYYFYTCDVGTFPQDTSPYGVLDMAGNAYEYVSDWYSSDYYAISPYNNPQGPSTGSYHVLRGYRSSGRNEDLTNWAYRLRDHFGFRCAMSASN